MTKFLEICARLALFACLACFPVGAVAQEAGPLIICDTAEQVREVVQLANSTLDIEGSIEKVNTTAAATPPACGIAELEYFQGETVGQVKTNTGPRDIVQVLIIGVVMPGGVQRVPPLVQFTIVKPKGEDA